jgi:GT2 family glycosyltransferase
MRKSSFQVSVVLATYNRGQQLIDTIEHVLDNTYPDFEIIVVDQTRNHKPEVTTALMAFQGDRRYRYVQLSIANLPLARNVGLRLARGEIIIYVDDDVIVGRDFINQHVRPYYDPTVGAVGGRIITQGYEPDANGVVSAAVGRLGKYGPLQGHFYKEGPPCKIEWGMGCNMSFRRVALEQAGGFDERYKESAKHEDVDAFVRVRREGYKAVFAPDAQLIHLKSPSGGCRSNADFKRQRSNRLRCEALIATCLHGSRPTALVGILKYGLQCALHAAEEHRRRFSEAGHHLSKRTHLSRYMMLLPSFAKFFGAFLNGVRAHYFESSSQISLQLSAELDTSKSDIFLV